MLIHILKFANYRDLLSKLFHRQIRKKTFFVSVIDMSMSPASTVLLHYLVKFCRKAEYRVYSFMCALFRLPDVHPASGS